MPLLAASLSALLAVPALMGTGDSAAQAQRQRQRQQRVNARILGLTNDNHLVLFNSRVRVGRRGRVIPRLESSRLRGISGLADGEQLVGIDLRTNGQLYGVSNLNRLYVLTDFVTGHAATATAVGNALTPALNGSNFGVDFNPVPDRLRIVSDAEQNLRVNPDSGATNNDAPLAYAAGDANAGRNPAIAGAGYTNSVAGATETTLYDIDTETDSLVVQNPPNAGTLTTIGALGVDTTFPALCH